MEQIPSLIDYVDADDSLAKFVSELLQKYYPGHPWLVQATHSQGQLTIRNPALSYKMGMRIFIPKIVNYNDLQGKIMRYAGEFLERHGVSRNPVLADREMIQEEWAKGRFK